MGSWKTSIMGLLKYYTERAAFYTITRPRIEGSVLQVVLLNITNEPSRQFPLS